MVKNVQPGVDELREVYLNLPSAKPIFDDFANRTNNQRLTKVEQLLNRLRDESVMRAHVIKLFRRLEELNHGKFIEGRKGHPSRFIWSSSQIDVGKAAQGQDGTIKPVPIDAEAEAIVDEVRQYSIFLRSGMDAKISLPADLSLSEAERLCAFLKAIAVPK